MRIFRAGLRPYAFRDVLAKNEEKIGSALLDPHFGHLTRFRSRAEMVMVKEYFFLHPPQRKS
ncbi:MAG TPA: hypothetical protein VEU07_11170 [Candidatus Acidoferrum sp.]|nr:hypothetical protein [Candidatus Acidoferrum sp.]